MECVINWLLIGASFPLQFGGPMPIEKVCGNSRNLREGQDRPVERIKFIIDKKAFVISEHYLSVLDT